MKKAAPKKFDARAAVQNVAASISEIQPGERVIDVPLSQIVPDPNQPRRTFDDGYIERLAASIKEVGQEQPAVLRKNLNGDSPYMLVSGECRWKACKLAGKRKISAVVREFKDDAAVYIAQCTENVQRADMSPADQIAAIVRMNDQVGSDRTSVVFGVAKSWISKCKTIYNAGGIVVEALDAGYTSDIEALYDLARAARKDEKAAGHLVAQWRAEAGSSFARQQTRALLAKLEGKVGASAAKQAAARSGGTPAGGGSDPHGADAPSSIGADAGAAPKTTPQGAAAAPAETDRVPLQPAGPDTDNSGAGHKVPAAPGSRRVNMPQNVPVLRVMEVRVEDDHVYVLTDRGPLAFEHGLIAALSEVSK